MVKAILLVAVTGLTLAVVFLGLSLTGVHGTVRGSFKNIQIELRTLPQP